MKLGHPPTPLASRPVLPSLSKDFQPQEPFPSIFLSRISSPANATKHSAPHAAGGRTLLGSAAPLSPLWRISPYGTESSSDQSPAHTPSSPGRLGGNLVPQQLAPRSHLTHRAPAPLLRALQAASCACALSMPPSPVAARSQKRMGRAVGSD